MVLASSLFLIATPDAQELTLDGSGGRLLIGDVGVAFYSDTAGLVGVEPTAGTLTFTVKTEQLSDIFHGFASNTVALASGNKLMFLPFPTIALKVSGLSGVSGGGALYGKLVYNARYA